MAKTACSRSSICLELALVCKWKYPTSSPRNPPLTQSTNCLLKENVSIGFLQMFTSIFISYRVCPDGEGIWHVMWRNHNKGAGVWQSNIA